VTIAEPARDLDHLRGQYPDAARALVRCHVTYRAGTDNLEAILRELDEVFPRWYDRDWTEASSLRPARPQSEIQSRPQSFHDRVIDYLGAQLTQHEDRTELLALAEALLAEEEP
jgi:hypothetical protein